jgi:hypothetical protein
MLMKTIRQMQGRSQGSTGVTVVRGPRAWEGPRRVPRGPQEGSQKESSPGKGCKSKGRCSLFLRKRKKIRKKNQSKGVLKVIGGPRSP